MESAVNRSWEGKLCAYSSMAFFWKNGDCNHFLPKQYMIEYIFHYAINHSYWRTLITWDLKLNWRDLQYRMMQKQINNIFLFCKSCTPDTIISDVVWVGLSVILQWHRVTWVICKLYYTLVTLWDGFMLMKVVVLLSFSGKDTYCQGPGTKLCSWFDYWKRRR